MRRISYFVLFIIMTVSCTSKVPDVFTAAGIPIKIYPDYSGITIPCNIAPLNFRIDEKADKYITNIYSVHEKNIKINGRTVIINIHAWKKLLNSNIGELLHIDIYIQKQGKWYKYKLENIIAREPIDEYISYRLIEPSYVDYENMSINQRNVTNFEENEIYNSAQQSTTKEGQCLNCHSYQNYYKTGNMQMHIRGLFAGTIIAQNGKLEKVNLKTDKTPYGGTYPSWHPTENLIAYSINSIGQDFHTNDNQKVEVTDTESDLILYDVDRNEVKYIIKSKDYLETFPYWAPDGKSLYFSSAYYKPTMKNVDADVSIHYKNIKYNLLKISFDIKTRSFGQVDTVFNAVEHGKSATFPRVSPDGKYLLFTMGDFGNFHIWHKSSDLYLINLETKVTRNLTEVNSPDAESYHSWSSNGRWIIFSSRREDGSYTRFYISYFDSNGNAHKPFILPQKAPEFYAQFLKSYNIPEFMVKPVKFSVHDFAITGSIRKAVFADTLSKF